MTGLLRAELLRLTSRRLGRVLALVLLGIALLVELRAFAVSHSGTSAVGADLRILARDALPASVTATSVAAAIMAFAFGASSVGAEWHHGTMQALLFWEPRRWRVLLAKALALVVVVVAFTAALDVVVWLLTYVVAATRGSTDGVTGGLMVSMLLRALRGFFLVSVTALFGFGVAGLARVTGAALGAAFVYFAILEQLVVGLRPGWQRYLVSSNLGAVMAKRVEVLSGGRGHSLLEPYVLTGGRGALTLLLYLAVLLGAFGFLFTTRDVT